MKIERKIYLATFVNFGLIITIATFALYSFDQISTKFRFTVIADDLNASFLEMRLLEKNYFLYGDKDGLLEIKKKIQKTAVTLDEVREDVVRAVGAAEFSQLQELLLDYEGAVSQVIAKNKKDSRTRTELRLVGQRLSLFAENITTQERKQVEGIIEKTMTVMRHSFWIVIAFAFFFSQFSVWRIRKSLRRVVSLTQSISKGDYRKIDAAPPTDEMGSVITAINSMADELKKREQAIVQSRRLASIGVLVAGVAHELNNPLNNISIIAQTYGEVYDNLDKSQRVGFMEQIEEQTERLRVIIKNLLDFSRPKDPRLTEKDINDVFQHSLELVQNMLTVSNIRVRLKLTENLPPVYVDEHQFQQVLINIMINAIQAMPPGGELGVRTAFVEADGDVQVSISDTGKGIEPKFLDHIFDPFFSTKEESGTGLGLWVSYGIVKNHKGNIEAKSTVGKGTVFMITLPTSKKFKRYANDGS